MQGSKRSVCDNPRQLTVAIAGRREFRPISLYQGCVGKPLGILFPGNRHRPTSHNHNERLGRGLDCLTVRLKLPVTEIFQLNLPCFHSLAVFLLRLGTHPYAIFESGKKERPALTFQPAYLLASKRCALGGTDTSGAVKSLRQSPGCLPDGGRRKNWVTGFTPPKHPANLFALVEYGFRESSIELGSAAPSSVVNPEDAVQTIGGRP